MRRIRAVLMVLAALATTMSSVHAHADAALLMEEPYGTFGAINPTGHAAVYLNHICAETPTELRPCRKGEFGVVISRYHRVAGYDWLAIPLVPYLYAVERVDDVPTSADAPLVAQLRDAYRRRHLLNIVPDVPTTGEDTDEASEIPKGDWTQLVGESYDRKIYGFEIATTHEQDERFIAEFNDRPNVSHFNLFFRNCADFSKALLNTYYPHAIRRNIFVDLGITTPKQVARSLTKYAKRHPELTFSTFVIPQVPGSIHRSRPINGVVEALVKSKKYVVPLVVLNPQLTAGMIVAYLTDGRFSPPKDARVELVPGHPALVTAANTDAPTPSDSRTHSDAPPYADAPSESEQHHPVSAIYSTTRAASGTAQ